MKLIDVIENLDSVFHNYDNRYKARLMRVYTKYKIYDFISEPEKHEDIS